MRRIVNISLPEKLNEVVERGVRKGKFSSKSEFFRSLLRLWEEQQLFEDIMASEKEFADGKGKVLKSLKDLR